jgi:hypothetical protein
LPRLPKSIDELAKVRAQMNDHPYHEELAALAAAGYLSDQERQELLEHLTSCEECRNAERAFGDIIRCLWPARSQLHQLVDALKDLPNDEELRARFLERARREGIKLSSEAQKRNAPRE